MIFLYLFQVIHFVELQLEKSALWTPLQHSCLENPMDGGAWWATVHEVAKSRTRLSDFTFTFHFHALEKEMATHSSVLAWRIPGTGEPGGLPSMGSRRIGHDWSDLAAAAAALWTDPSCVPFEAHYSLKCNVFCYHCITKLHHWVAALTGREGRQVIRTQV